MHASLPILVLPTDQHTKESQQITGCGCCQHCRCTGHCVDKLLRSPSTPSRAASPLSDRSNHKHGRKEDFISVLESAPHPGDAVALHRKSSRHRTGQKEGDGRHASSRSSSQSNLPVDSADKTLDKAQEEYEAAYRRRARESNARSKSDVKIEQQSHSDDEDNATVSTRRSHRSESSEHRKERQKEHLVAGWRETIGHHEEEDLGIGKVNSRGSDASDKRERNHDIVEIAKEDEVQRKRSQHRTPKVDVKHREGKSSDEKHRGGIPRSPLRTAGISINGLDPHQDDQHITSMQQSSGKARSKREIMREIRHLVKEAAMAPSSTSNKTLGALCTTTAALTDIQKAIEKVEEIDDTHISPLKIIQRLSVHLSTDYGSTLLFQDASKRNDNGQPVVAFRLQDADCTLEKKGGAGFTFKKHDHDWLHDSYANGAKVKGKLSVGVGVKGSSIYEINTRRRKVDRFEIHSLEDDFSTKPNGGSHDDHHHLYFETPDGTAMKWEMVEDDRLMRLYGRGEKDYGVIYAEAKMHHRKHKSKEAVLVFYDPNDPAQHKSKGHVETEVDYAFLCATWFCARQTFDESRLVAAHDEVHFIENIEDAFEIDLLALA